ncbi:MAG TPA: DUF58 domain-containing protein [Casimicrobiaceae bacterium]|jgi:uncharacterized protein (DUF58 family)|nr:DUF58 domain-containing protein [Casimicrobiaceae bacterium]
MKPALQAAAGAASWPRRARQRLWRVAPADRAPVVLRHRRIYILPTRRGLALIATLATMLVTSMNYALSLGHALTFLVAGLVAAAVLQTFRNLAGIAVSPLAAGEAFVGGKIGFTLSLANAGRARQGIVIAPRAGNAVTVDLPAGATRQVQLTLLAPRRGHVALGRVTLSTDFPLGLWRGWAYVHFPLSGIAYPAPEAAAPQLPPGLEGADVRRSARVADAELTGLRDYHPGDPLNRIAWKAVARGAGWYSKHFEGTGGSGTLEFNWTELPSSLGVEARLGRFCAWVLAAEREMRPFSLQLPGTELPAGSGAGQRRAALTALALYPAEGAS